MSRLLLVLLASLPAVAAPQSLAQARCDSPGWLPADGFPGTAGVVSDCALWDPDGAGPLDTCLVAVGNFTHAGNAHAKYIAMYDLTHHNWSAFDIEPDGRVETLAVTEAGALLIGGDFTHIGEKPIQRIAAFDGAQWSGFGRGIAGKVNDIEISPAGEIMVAGNFMGAGNSDARMVARWNGVDWEPIGDGFLSEAFALRHTTDGTLYAAGNFMVARWGESGWEYIASALLSRATALAALSNGDLVMGGSFQSFMGPDGRHIIPNVARWDGSKWYRYGDEKFSGDVYAIHETSTGNLVVNGILTSHLGANQYFDSPLLWDGQRWSLFGGGIEYCAGRGYLELPNGKSLIYGGFSEAGGRGTLNIATFENGIWCPLSEGVNGWVVSIDSDATGRTVVAGGFSTFMGTNAKQIVEYTNGQWRTLGDGIRGGLHRVAALSHNRVAVIGRDLQTSTLPDRYTALLWDGSAWTQLSGTRSRFMHSIHEGKNGLIYAGGYFSMPDDDVFSGLAIWNGQEWDPVGPNLHETVQAFDFASNGEIYAATNRGVHRWDGTNWHTLLNRQYSSFNAVRILDDDSVIVGGYTSSYDGLKLGHIIRWDGQSWSTLGTGLNNGVVSIDILSDGTFVVGGNFTEAGDQPASGVALWNGKEWKGIEGLGPSRQDFGLISAVSVLPDNSILVGGRFRDAGPYVSPYFARYGCPTPPCLPDTNHDGVLSPADFTAWIAAFNAQAAECDQNGDGSCSPADFTAWIANFNAGCD